MTTQQGTTMTCDELMAYAISTEQVPWNCSNPGSFYVGGVETCCADHVGSCPIGLSCRTTVPSEGIDVDIECNADTAHCMVNLLAKIPLPSTQTSTPITHQFMKPRQHSPISLSPTPITNTSFLLFFYLRQLTIYPPMLPYAAHVHV